MYSTQAFVYRDLGYKLPYHVYEMNICKVDRYFYNTCGQAVNRGENGLFKGVASGFDYLTLGVDK